MKPRILFNVAALTMALGLYGSVGAQQKFKLPALPYEMNALAPKMSQETMEYHYGKHYKSYIDNLNSMIPGTQYATMTLTEIVAKAEPGAIFNNAGQALNHELFFLGMSPDPQAKPSGNLSYAIDKSFGSFDNFKAEFAKTASGVFGSGWAWLATDKAGNLSITSEANGSNPARHGLIPLMGLDVWEHAYYIDYRNRRADYMTNYWDLVDWKVIGGRYDKR